MSRMILRLWGAARRRQLLNWIPDRRFLGMAYKLRTGDKLNLDPPKKFNEKLQWLKLYNRQSGYTVMADKFSVKQYVSEAIGEKYVIPNVGGPWAKFSDIPFDELPDRFVLKCSHDSGGVVIVTDKKAFDRARAEKKFNKTLRRNYFYEGREWPYKNITPRLFAEQYMEDSGTKQLMDYKIHCFNGVPKVIQVDFDRFTSHKRNLYNLDWTLIPGEIEYPSDEKHIIEKPECLDDMVSIAERLAKDTPYLRVDLYVVDGRIYFGEMTFFHEGGMGKFKPEKMNLEWGEWINLPEKHPG